MVRSVLEGYATDRRLKHRVVPLLAEFSAADKGRGSNGNGSGSNGNQPPLPSILAAPIEL